MKIADSLSFVKLIQNEPKDPKRPETILSALWYCTGRRFTAATLHNTSCSEDKIGSEWRAFGSNEHIRETKVADSVLLTVFICSYVMCNTAPRPIAPASAELYSQTDSEWLQWPKRTSKYIICTMMMYGETFYGCHTVQHQLQWR